METALEIVQHCAVLVWAGFGLGFFTGAALVLAAMTTRVASEEL